MHHPTERIAHTRAFVTPVVEHWLEREIAQWVHHFSLQPVLVKQMPWYVLFCLWDDAYKRTLAANWKE